VSSSFGSVLELVQTEVRKDLEEISLKNACNYPRPKAGKAFVPLDSLIEVKLHARHAAQVKGYSLTSLAPRLVIALDRSLDPNLSIKPHVGSVAIAPPYR